MSVIYRVFVEDCVGMSLVGLFSNRFQPRDKRLSRQVQGEGDRVERDDGLF